MYTGQPGRTADHQKPKWPLTRRYAGFNAHFGGAGSVSSFPDRPRSPSVTPVASTACAGPGGGLRVVSTLSRSALSYLRRRRSRFP